MKVRQNAQNQHDNETGTGPGGERPIRYQTDFHPVALEMIAHQDATRKRDLDNVEDGNYPPAHCPSLWLDGARELRSRRYTTVLLRVCEARRRIHWLRYTDR